MSLGKKFLNANLIKKKDLKKIEQEERASKKKKKKKKKGQSVETPETPIIEADGADSSSIEEVTPPPIQEKSPSPSKPSPAVDRTVEKLIRKGRVKDFEGEKKFHYINPEGRIRSIYVHSKVVMGLEKGEMAIVEWENNPVVVDRYTGQIVRQKNADWVVFFNK